MATEDSERHKLSDSSHSELAVCTTTEDLKVSYQCSLDVSVKIDATALQATFDKALLDHIASQSAFASPCLDSDKVNAIPTAPARQAPRTSAGVEIPLEIMSSILGCLKADHQIQSLTSFQQCSRYAYVIARPIIYTDLVVSLHGLGMIQSMVYLPSCMNDFKDPVSASLSAIDPNPESMDSQDDIIHHAEHESVTTSPIYTTMKSAMGQLENRLVHDGTEGSLAIQDLEEGTGSKWFGLKGADRLRYNARGVVRMSLVPSKTVGPKYFESGKKLYAMNAWGRVGTEIEDEAWRSGSERLRAVKRPFQRLDELRIENLCLLQLRQEWDAFAAAGLHNEFYDNVLFGSLKALSCAHRLSALRVDLPYRVDESPYCDPFTYNFGDFLHHLPRNKGQRIRLTGPAETIYQVVGIANPHLAKLDCLTIDLSAQTAEAWPPYADIKLFYRMLPFSKQDRKRKPKKITWVVRCPWGDRSATLQSLHEQRHTAATSLGSKKLRTYAQTLCEILDEALEVDFDLKDRDTKDRDLVAQAIRRRFEISFKLPDTGEAYITADDRYCRLDPVLHHDSTSDNDLGDDSTSEPNPIDDDDNDAIAIED
jgi:hypothetical protein